MKQDKPTLESICKDLGIPWHDEEVLAIDQTTFTIVTTPQGTGNKQKDNGSVD